MMETQALGSFGVKVMTWLSGGWRNYHQLRMGKEKTQGGGFVSHFP